MTSTNTMERHAVISESVYMNDNNDRLQHINHFYQNEYELIKKHTDKHHIVLRHKPSNKYILGIRGTDIQDNFGQQKADLKADALVTLGLTTLSNRYKKSDKKLNKIIQEYGKDNVSITGHSLGATIASELSHKHQIESHGFNRGGTHATFALNKLKSIHPKHKENAKRNNVYFSTPSITKGFDPLSIQTSIDPLANIHFVKQHDLDDELKGVISPHSIAHFHPKKVIELSKDSKDKTDIQNEFKR